VAQTRKRRKRKHRGTQAGTVERARPSRRPAATTDRRELARQRREERLSRPPSWRGALGRAGLAAALFLVIAYFLLDRRPTAVIIPTILAFLVYLPAAYYTDMWRYRRWMRRSGGGAAGRPSRSRPRG
jgi:hypothetical protein